MEQKARTGFAQAIETVQRKEQEKSAEEQKNYSDAKTALEKIKETIHELTVAAEKLFTVARENAAQRNAITGIHAETETTAALPGLVGNAGAMATATKQTLGSLTGLLQDVVSTQQSTQTAVAITHESIKGQQEQIKQLARSIQDTNSRVSNTPFINPGH